MDKNISVRNIENKNGRAVVNQFVITTRDGEYFQSYASLIAFRPYDRSKKITLNEDKWDYSRTTMKYLNIFLRTKSKAQIIERIDSGEYELVEL